MYALKAYGREKTNISVTVFHPTKKDGMPYHNDLSTDWLFIMFVLMGDKYLCNLTPVSIVH